MWILSLLPTPEWVNPLGSAAQLRAKCLDVLGLPDDGYPVAVTEPRGASRKLDLTITLYQRNKARSGQTEVHDATRAP